MASQEADLQHSASESESEDEAIVVTRQQEAVDPEDEAEFEREYAKMMAESLESRKFERKPLFDVPLPVRPKNKEPTGGLETNDGGIISSNAGGNTMAFSLLTKKGNRQQVFLVFSSAVFLIYPHSLTRLVPLDSNC
jgi:regulator of nonsense transcripts 2